jgi:hypothetical protein
VPHTHERNVETASSTTLAYGALPSTHARITPSGGVA